MTFIKPLGCMKWPLLINLILLQPVLLQVEPWVLVLQLLPLRRQKALAFITSLPILDHGIRIHVSSLVWTCKAYSYLEDRYSSTESLCRTFVIQFTSLKSQRVINIID